MPTHTCQDADIKPASSPVGRIHTLSLRAMDHLRREGPLSLAGRTARFVGRCAIRSLRVRPAHTAARNGEEPEALGLHEGEWVRIRSAEEIRRTLDSDGRHRGLGFMPAMFRYCGTRLRVYKRAERILLEGTGEMRRLRDVVLLDGAICDGEGFACDRSCFFFWKEIWLARSEAPE